jgi:hypothetical protein
MKPILIALSLMLYNISVSAQLTKNTWLVGGMGSFYSNIENQSTSSFSVQYRNIEMTTSASVGYFLATRFCTGLRPIFSWNKNKWTGVSTGGVGGGYGNNIRYAIGPFARYYFLNDNKQFNLLSDISYQLGVNKNIGSNNSKDKGKYNTLFIAGGIEIFFNTTAGIEILLGYTEKVVSTENSPVESESNKKGLQVSIGFQLHLEKE